MTVRHLQPPFHASVDRSVVGSTSGEDAPHPEMRGTLHHYGWGVDPMPGSHVEMPLANALCCQSELDQVAQRVGPP